MQIMIIKTSKKKNWCAVNVQPSLLVEVSKVAQSIKKNSSSSNASSAVQLLNGSVGVTLTFAKNATRNNVQVITFLENLEISCLNAMVKTVH
jgi:hypothetical protein